MMLDNAAHKVHVPKALESVVSQQTLFLVILIVFLALAEHRGVDGRSCHALTAQPLVQRTSFVLLHGKYFLYCVKAIWHKLGLTQPCSIVVDVSAVVLLLDLVTSYVIVLVHVALVVFIRVNASFVIKDRIVCAGTLLASIGTGKKRLRVVVVVVVVAVVVVAVVLLESSLFCNTQHGPFVFFVIVGVVIIKGGGQ